MLSEGRTALESRPHKYIGVEMLSPTSVCTPPWEPMPCFLFGRAIIFARRFAIIETAWLRFETSIYV
jgi:hypothetical protein